MWTMSNPANEILAVIGAVLTTETATAVIDSTTGVAMMTMIDQFAVELTEIKSPSRIADPHSLSHQRALWPTFSNQRLVL